MRNVRARDELSLSLALANQSFKRFSNFRRNSDHVADIIQLKRFAGSVSVKEQHDAFADRERNDRTHDVIRTLEFLGQLLILRQRVEDREAPYSLGAHIGECVLSTKTHRDSLHIVLTRAWTMRITAFRRFIRCDKECCVVEVLTCKRKEDGQDFVTCCRLLQKLERKFDSHGPTQTSKHTAWTNRIDGKRNKAISWAK